MSEFKYVCIPVRTEKEGIETAEDVIGTMMWNNDEHQRPQAWPYDNDNPIIVMDSPLLLEKQLAEARAEIECKDKLIERMREALKSAEVVVDFYEANNEGAGRGIGKMFKAALAAERGEG